MADKTGYIGRNPGDSSVTVARQTFTASGITTDFTFSSGYVTGYFDLYINGVKMIEGSDYTSSDGSTFSVLNGGAADGDVLEAVAYKAFNATTIDSAPGNFTVGTNLTVNGTSTLTGNTTVGSAITLSSSTALVGSAITLTASTGIVSATAFYGDGSNLSNIISGVGINSGGTNIGYGVTTLNFVGSGTTIEVSGTTANISAGGGGGGSGVSSTGILTARGFANADDITESITLDDYYGTGTNYGMVGPITVTGSGTTVTVGVGVSYVII
tara:strand:- start:7183 stop:7992 length:810 start_codon:yes stop_codon:yes gene_type:complete